MAAMSQGIVDQFSRAPIESPHVFEIAQRHRLHPRARPGGAHDLGGPDLLSRAARDLYPQARALVLAAPAALARALYLAYRALGDGHRDPPGREDRFLRVHRPR